MSSSSDGIAPSLVEAYRGTEFRVADRGWVFTLCVDQPSPVLVACHEAFGVARSAYLTAWNPRSEPQTREVNEAAQAQLEAELTAMGLPFLHGEGVDPSGEWPGEASVLVLGIREEEAVRLGRRHGQNAIVVAGRDALARLVMLASPSGDRT
jgi:hypothetical protein